MDTYTLLYYLLEFIMFIKHVLEYISNELYKIPIVSKMYDSTKNTIMDLHDQMYLIRREPTDKCWISISSVHDSSKEESYEMFDDNTESELSETSQENKLIKQNIETYKNVNLVDDQDYSIGEEPQGEKLEIPREPTVLKKNINFNEYYIKNALQFFGGENHFDSTPCLFPVVNKNTKNNIEKYNSLFNESIVKRIFEDEEFLKDDKFPLMYMIKTGDESMKNNTKDPYEFYSYFIVHYLNDQDDFIKRIDNGLSIRKPCKIQFLSIEYSHPEMNTCILINIPENMMYVGNEILSSTFIYRYLEYNYGEKAIFDENYKLTIMTKDIRFFVLKSNQYMYLNNENDFTIINI